MEETQISHSADQVCNATKEELLANGKRDVVDLCPLCQKRGRDLEVGCHRSAGASVVGVGAVSYTPAAGGDSAALPPDIAELFAQAPLPLSIHYKFQFNQRGGRMQVKDFADRFGIHGSIKRISLHRLHCVAVFAFPADKEIIKTFVDFAKELPDFRQIGNPEKSTKYSRYLTNLFEVTKTRKDVFKRVLEKYEGNNSDEPDDAVSDTSSVVSTSSGTSSYI